MDCIFCQIIAGKIPSTAVYQDDHFIVINDIHPAAPVHMLVIPKKHVADFMDTDAKMMGDLMQIVRKMITTKKVTNYRLVTNGGGAAFIDHLHVHILGSVAQDRNL
jgi:histidine triad (HIT) family protein